MKVISFRCDLLFFGWVLFALSGCSLAVGALEECETDADCTASFSGQENLVCLEKMCVQNPNQDHDSGPNSNQDHDSGPVPEVIPPGCDYWIGETDPEVDEDELITFGALLSMTTESGESNPRGDLRSKAIGLALQHFNQWGGVDNKKFRVQICDTQGQSIESLTTYFMEEQGWVGVITSGSADTVAASNVTIDAGALLMSISASSMGISDLNDNGLVWRVSPSDASLADYVASLITEQSEPTLAKVAVIYNNDVYGDGLQTAFMRWYSPDDSSKRRSFPYSYNAEDDDPGVANQAIKNAIEDVIEFQPDRLFIIAFAEDGAGIINELGAIEEGLPAGADLIFADSIKSEVFLSLIEEENRKVVSRALGVSAGNPSGEVYEHFNNEFSSTYQEDPTQQGYLPHSYDVGYCMALATVWAMGDGGIGTLTGAALADGMGQLAADIPKEDEKRLPFLKANVPKLKTFLQNGEPVNINGATGELEFNENGEPPGGAGYDIWYIFDGEFQDDEPPPDGG